MTTNKEIARKLATPKAGKGGVIPPVDKQFGQPNGNPRHSGAWKKESTPRYKLEQMMKLSEMELKKIATDEQAPLFERKLAIAIRKGEWKEIEAMINQVYGKPNQSIDMTSNGETVAPTTLVRFVDDRSKNT